MGESVGIGDSYIDEILEESKSRGSSVGIELCYWLDD
jgi:hypothetical protein